MEFIGVVDYHGITILVLPPRTTHHLQPLDIVLFHPLATAYSLELERLMPEGESGLSMSNRFFWPKFKRVWLKRSRKRIYNTPLRFAGVRRESPTRRFAGVSGSGMLGRNGCRCSVYSSEICLYDQSVVQSMYSVLEPIKTNSSFLNGQSRCAGGISATAVASR